MEEEDNYGFTLCGYFIKKSKRCDSEMKRNASDMLERQIFF